MISLNIKNVKKFMSLLLVSEAFDTYLLEEATITTNASFHIDGKIPNGFYTDEEKEELGISKLDHIPYSLIKASCFDLIKGKRTPVSFKFVFLLPEEIVGKLIAVSDVNFDTSAITNMCLMCTFSEGKLVITSGISYQTFVLSHDLDKALDNYIKKSLNKAEIDFEDNF